jgi:hypothetical protein
VSSCRQPQELGFPWLLRHLLDSRREVKEAELRLHLLRRGSAVATREFASMWQSEPPLPRRFGASILFRLDSDPSAFPNF